MTQPGYKAEDEPMYWWKVALHLDEAQLALTNAMAHNVDDPRPIHALHDRLREGQAILLEIFRAKGLLPGSTNGTHEAPMPPMSGVPVPMGVYDGAAASAGQAPPLAAEELAAPEANQDVEGSEPLPEAAATAPILPPVPTTATTTDPGAGGAGG